MRKYLLIFSLGIIFLAGFAIYQKITFDDGKLHVVMCDVGQGDGIFIRTPGGANIVIDGGPDDKILTCLSNHMPFWDRTITLIILTHPHADHYTGLTEVLQRYTLKHFVTEKLENPTAGFKAFEQTAQAHHINTQYVSAGAAITFPDKVKLQIVGPTKEFLETTSPGGTIGESKEFGSVETLLTFGNFSALFSGDSQADELATALDIASSSRVSVFQVPHHGSSSGMNADLFAKMQPSLAVISVGAGNRYGHPAPGSLYLLQSLQIKTLRTDENGDIEIVTDGKTFGTKVEKNRKN
ncbi:MAG TPA: MBL fold metallo-hydrolase [Candidatus Saccharimonadales bacterium]|nr:MBL fold metallo-hydrolase [Candidatus Saccharimonadales bacterium]